MSSYSNSSYSANLDGPKLVELPDPVPILDEHLLKDEKGREITYLDGKKLQRIADNNNRRVVRTGDLAPLVVGHTQDGQNQKQESHMFLVSVGRTRTAFVS